jgi:hypothetical protein
MKPTPPGSKQVQRVCHDTLPWLISFSLDLVIAALKAILIVGGFLCITAPLAYYLWLREFMLPVAAYQVMDIPEAHTGPLAFFNSASWSVPVLWLVSALLVIVEAATRRCWRFLLIYAAIPFIGGAIFWVAWQGYLIYLDHVTA